MQNIEISPDHCLCRKCQATVTMSEVKMSTEFSPTNFIGAREALLVSIENNGAPDPNLFSRSWIAEKLGRSVRIFFGRSPTLHEMKESFSLVIDNFLRDTTLQESLLRSMRRLLDTAMTYEL